MSVVCVHFSFTLNVTGKIFAINAMNGFAVVLLFAGLLLVEFKVNQNCSKICQSAFGCTLYTIGIRGKIFSHETFF